MNTIRRAFHPSGITSVAIFSLLSFVALAGDIRDARADGAMLAVQLSSIADSGTRRILRGTMRNSSGSSLAILRWHLPDAGNLSVPLFIITNENGTSAPYTGILVKRPAPGATDFLMLKSGAELAWEVDLTRYYQLGTNQRYLVRVNPPYIDARIVLRNGAISNDRASISANEVFISE